MAQVSDTRSGWEVVVDPHDYFAELLDELEPEPEPRFERHAVERIERWVERERRIGLRSWIERELVVTYRTVKP